MPKVNFTSALKRFYPDLIPQEVPGETIAEILSHLERKYPGLSDYLLDEEGSLRKHVNIYVGEELIQDRDRLEDRVTAKDSILIFQALSGG